MNKKVFTYWEDPVGQITPPLIQLCLESLKKFAPNHVVLTPDNIDSYLTTKDLHPNWKKLPFIANKADCVRVAMIKKYGGLWVDADTVFIRPIEKFFSYIDGEKDFYYLEWDDGRVLNGYFYGKENSGILTEWLQKINRHLSVLQSTGTSWTSFGEQLLTPLAKWKFKDSCRKLDRSIFIPINFDKIPFVFLETFNYRSMIQHNTISVALNNSFLNNNLKPILSMTKNDLLSTPMIFSQALRDSHFGFTLSPVDLVTQEICKWYSYGSISYGDLIILSTLLSNKEHVVEIGVNQGTTTRLLSLLNTHVTGIDLFEDVGQVKDDVWREEYTTNFNNNSYTFDKIKGYLSDRDNITLRKGYSSSLAEAFAEESIDGIFVDGDHSYNGVKEDTEAWLSKVKIEGLLIYHDVTHPKAEVAKYYSETLVKDKRLEEIKITSNIYFTSIKAFRRIK